MSTRIEQFTVGDHPRVEVTNTSGQIAVVPGVTGSIEVAIDANGENYAIEQLGDTVSVRPVRGFLKRIFSSDILIRVPEGTVVEARNASGDIAIEASTAGLDAVTASGDIRARPVAGAVRIKTASGDISVERVTGSLDVVTASGDTRTGSVDGHLTVKSASGDVTIGRCGGNVVVNSASGGVRINRLDGVDVEVRTLSGDVVVGIPPRRRIELDMQSMSGELRNRLPEGDGSPPEATVRIRAASISGDVTMEGVS